MRMCMYCAYMVKSEGWYFLSPRHEYGRGEQVGQRGSLGESHGQPEGGTLTDTLHDVWCSCEALQRMLESIHGRVENYREDQLKFRKQLGATFGVSDSRCC